MKHSLAALVLLSSTVSCSSAATYCTGQWSVAKFGNCDVSKLDPGLEITYLQPDPQACTQALNSSCQAAERTTLEAQFTCQQAVATSQPTCVDGGEVAWSQALLEAQTSCMDAGVSQVCLAALEQSQQPDGGSPDGGPVPFCNRSISAAYDIGGCDFGDAGLVLPFVGEISSPSTEASCEGALMNCTDSDIVTLNSQVDCANGIPLQLGTCVAGGEETFVKNAEAKNTACHATKSGMTERCVEALTGFGFYSPDGG
jgi:hypothetical protein